MNDVTSPAETVRAPRLALSVQRATRARGAPLKAEVARAVRATLERDAEITVRFVDEEEGLALNHAYRHQDHATNVLSFVYETGPVVRGDLVLCVPVIEREASVQGKTLLAHYMHLVVHGVLHLHGYDHEIDIDAAHMEARETRIVTGLGFADPYTEPEQD